MSQTVKEKRMNFNFDRFKDMIENYGQDYSRDVTAENYFGFPAQPIFDIENSLIDRKTQSVAYFSMEYGIAPSIYNSFKRKEPLDPDNRFFVHEVFSNNWLCDYLFKIHIDKMLDIPIYGGGLGVLAGDTMKSIADMGYSVVGLGILWNRGYFKQRFWYKHGQLPEELRWDPDTYPGLIPLTTKVVLDTQEGPLTLKLWKYYIYSYDKERACPLILLDSDCEENPEHFRRLTDQLYRSDDVWWKIFQRAILGIGGMKALSALDYHIDRYHLNEGHAAFALVEKYMQLEKKEEMESWKDRFVYTCHTPVAAGHDRFSVEDLRKVLNENYVTATESFGHDKTDESLINLTYLCLQNCRKVNAVAQKHGDVMRIQFPEFADDIKAITNGVHLHTWVSQSFSQLFDKYGDVFGDWRREPKNLKRVRELRDSKPFRKDIISAHQENKRNFLSVIRNWKLKENVLTIGWARRIAGYKRPSLIFHNTKRLLDLSERIGPLQIILAGKAHPNDDIGGAHIDAILDHIEELNDYKDRIKVLILENYDTYFGKLLTSSVDVWLNNPLPPFEASGTSGMKAILNGVLQLTTLDGWVVEAAEDDIGWIFGYRHEGEEMGQEKDQRLDEDSEALYQTLEEVLNLYQNTFRDGAVDATTAWVDKMIHCIEQGAFFNTQRMIGEYHDRMWQLKKGKRR